MAFPCKIYLFFLLFLVVPVVLGFISSLYSNLPKYNYLVQIYGRVIHIISFCFLFLNIQGFLVRWSSTLFQIELMKISHLHQCLNAFIYERLYRPCPLRGRVVRPFRKFAYPVLSM